MASLTKQDLLCDACGVDSSVGSGGHIPGKTRLHGVEEGTLSRGDLTDQENVDVLDSGIADYSVGLDLSLQLCLSLRKIA